MRRVPFNSEREIHKLGRCGYCVNCTSRWGIGGGGGCLTIHHLLQDFRREQLNDARALKHVEKALAPLKRERVKSFLRIIIRSGADQIRLKRAWWEIKRDEEYRRLVTICWNCDKAAIPKEDGHLRRAHACCWNCYEEMEDDGW